MSETKTNKVTEFFNKFLTPEQKLAFKNEFGEIPLTPIVPVTPVVAAAQEAKLKDGTVIKYDTPTLIEGSLIMVVGTDGTELPAPDGDWELEDGTLITTAAGKVTVLKAVEVAPAEPVVQAAVTPEPNKLVEALKILMEGKFSEQAKLIDALTAENKELKESFTKQTEVVNTVSAFFNAIMETKTGEVPKLETGLSKKSQNVLSYL